MGVSEIAEKLGITKANASQHLAIMRGQNIVKTRREGITILYSLANTKILVAYDALKKSVKRTAGNQRKIIRKILK